MLHLEGNGAGAGGSCIDMCAGSVLSFTTERTMSTKSSGDRTPSLHHTRVHSVTLLGEPLAKLCAISSLKMLLLLCSLQCSPPALQTSWDPAGAQTDALAHKAESLHLKEQTASMRPTRPLRGRPGAESVQQPGHQCGPARPWGGGSLAYARSSTAASPAGAGRTALQVAQGVCVAACLSLTSRHPYRTTQMQH